MLCRKTSINLYLALCCGGLFASIATVAGQENALIQFDIGPEPLSDALNQLGEQSDHQILFAPSAVDKLRSPAVHGKFSVPQALDVILRGSNLRYQVTGDRTIAIMQIRTPLGESVHQAEVAREVSRSAASPTSALAPSVEEVVVTGTSIHGLRDFAPVGSHLITIGQTDIAASGAQTIDEVLHQTPALSSMGQAGQSQHNSTYFTPNIHEFGGSASGSTLVVLDGMRFPQGSTSVSQPDPSIVPTNALERVDILADGSSSIYGSDAVAGVVNFITRKGYDGLEVSGEAGYANNYDRLGASLLWGKVWSDGSAMLAFQHSYLSDLRNNTRLGDLNYTASGGGNFDTFNCNPATVQPNGSGNIILSPTSTTSLASTNAAGQSNGTCTNTSLDYLPKETRDNALVKLSQDFGSKLTVNVETLYAIRKDVTYSNSGTLTATAYGAGPQANPFYINPPGVTATKQTIRYDFTGLIPTTASPNGANDIYANINAEYRITDEFTISAFAVFGQDSSYQYTSGALCASCATLALNGTAQTSGSTTTPSVANTTAIFLTLPLTAANALDVWDPVASNKTSAATLASISSAYTGLQSNNSFEQYRLVADGTLFNLPAGPLKIAVGGEWADFSLFQATSTANGTGPSSTGSAYDSYHFGRSVKSAFGEGNFPLISPEMAIPFVQKLTVDISGRYDEFSDVGSTFNPKYAIDWQVLDGLKLFANVSTAFVAPPLESVGDPSQQYRAIFAHAGLYQTPTAFPTSLYPGTAGVLPGCPAGATTCQVGTATTPGLVTQEGIGPLARPATGGGYSIGTTIAPLLVPGFDASVTFFSNYVDGAVSAPTATAEANISTINKYFQICPAGCTTAQINSALASFPALTSAVSSTVYFIFNNNELNVLDLRAEGLDISTEYSFNTNIYGHFTIADSLTEMVEYLEGDGFPIVGPKFNVLNTDGTNGQFPQIQTQMRAHFGWIFEDVSADVFWNFTGSYRDWLSPINPVTHDASGLPNGGGDKVASNSTFDMHVAYNFSDGMFSGDQIFMNGTNIFDKKPPFYNVASGNDDLVTNLIGRVLEVGLRAKF